MKAIAAVDKNWGIGYKGELLVRIPEDLKRFKTLTMGNVVIMGRKTLLTLPGGLPLKGRENIIFTRDERFLIPGGTICHSVDMLLSLLEAPRFSGKDAFVIGGAEIYSLLISFCDTALITRIDDIMPADRFFPSLDGSDGWELTKNGPDLGGYAYLEYRNIRKS